MRNGPNRVGIIARNIVMVLQNILKRGLSAKTYLKVFQVIEMKYKRIIR